jgi:hypothetical protein
MMADLLIVGLTVFFGVSLGVFAYAVWQANTPRARTDHQSVADAASETSSAANTDETVRCPTCGTTNERRYRYCCEFLDDLPAGSSSIPDSVGTDNRQIP